MKVTLSLFAVLLAMAAVPSLSATALTFSDRVIITDAFYGTSDVSLFEGSEGPTFIGGLAIFGQQFDVFLTEPGTNIISDHLYSPGGSITCGDGNLGDCVFFASEGSLDAFIGTICTEGQVCTDETGQLQDVTALISLQLNQQQGTGGGFGTLTSGVQVQSTLPEPGSLLLLGSGLAAIGGAIRRRTQTMRKRTPE